MTTLLSLRDVPSSCFDGVFPALLATCSLDGVPNATWLSHVYLVDDEHIALSCQFFRKTLENLAQCPEARLLLGDPLSFRQYQLDIRFLGRETSGRTFDAIQRRLATVAALTGMQSVFALRSADSFVVTRIEEVSVESALPAESAPSRRDPLGGLARFSESLAVCGELGALVDTGLGFLSSHLGFESVSLYLLEEAEGVLFALASRGFPSSGVGARIALGEGVVGICGQQRMPIRIADTSRESRYAQAVQEQAQRAGYQLERYITPPGLRDVKSQLVVPLIMQGRLFGVLSTESRRPMVFDENDTLVLSTAGHLLAQGIALHQGEEGERPATDREPPQATSQMVRVRYYEADDSVFVDDDYIIKGLPGRILWLLLELREQEGRSTFQNRELRLHPKLKLPGYKDNLETRLLLLQRRLEEKGLPISISRRERGKLRLECEAKLELSSVAV